MVVSPGQRLIQRWNLQTLRREKTVPLPGEGAVKKVLMGCNSAGPLLLRMADGTVALWDIEAMRPMTVRGRVLGGGPHYEYTVRVSADGQTFVGWTSGLTGQHFGMMNLVGDTTRIVDSPDDHSFNGWWVQPNANAGLLLGYGGRIYTAGVKAIASDTFKDCVLLPTEDPRIFLSVHGQDAKHSQVTICTTADRRQLYTVRDIEPLTTATIFTEWAQFQGEPRVHYLPKERVLATLPSSNDGVVIRPLNVVQALKDSGEDFLFVVSRPPVGAEPALSTSIRSRRFRSREA